MKLFNIKGTIQIATILLFSPFVSLAADTPKSIQLPLSHVAAIDTTNMTFTVKTDSTNLTVRYTSKTRFFINKMPVVSKDLEVSDHVSGTLRPMTNGVPEAIRIKIVKLAPK